MSTPAARPRAIPALTGLRFFAAFLVLFFHFGATFTAHLGGPAVIGQFVNNMFMGVSVFFVLSGFILTHAHQNDIVDGRFVTRFFVSRFARIYPVYILSLLLALPFVYTQISTATIIADILMLQSWTPAHIAFAQNWVTQAWTLSVELFFYIMYPIVLIGVRRMSGRATIILAGILAILIVVFGLTSVGPGSNNIPFFAPDTVVLLPIFRFAEFLLGVTACRLSMLYPDLRSALKVPFVDVALVVAAMVCLALSTNAHGLGIFTLIVTALIVELSIGQGVVARLLSTNILVLLGGASYAVYLMQAPVRAMCHAIIGAPLDKFLSPFVIIGAAVLVFLYWEQPMRRAILGLYRQSLLRPSVEPK